MKLHLGCGRDYKKNFINVDFSPDVNPDKVWDLEKTPLPFKDNSIDLVEANHILEHINNFVPLMHDLWRICKNNALIKIKVPFYSTWGQYNDPTHVRFFTPFTFNYFTKGTYSHEVGCKRTMFKVLRKKINFGIGPSRKVNWILNPLLNFNHKVYCRFFSWILPAAEIEFILMVKK